VFNRLLDISVALAAMIVLSPLLGIVAVAIRILDGAPVLFRQLRPGLHGQPFTIFKFRTMRSTGADEVAYYTDDQRVTRLGRILRAASIDELPELWNVLRGDMSLVGPRPLLMEYLDQYTPEQARRHLVRPGITSWAAVNGRHQLRFEERIALDVWYVDHRSLRLDLRILWMTLRQVLRREGVTATQDPVGIGFPLPPRQEGSSVEADRPVGDSE
jgi:lipopolysaccharide/colanic/teichoic acid biosynthesis glycosyltransferase